MPGNFVHARDTRAMHTNCTGIIRLYPGYPWNDDTNPGIPFTFIHRSVKQKQKRSRFPCLAGYLNSVIVMDSVSSGTRKEQEARENWMTEDEPHRGVSLFGVFWVPDILCRVSFVRLYILHSKRMYLGVS